MIEQIHNTALHAIEKASLVVINAYELPKDTEFKGRTDLVTATDKESESILINEIQNVFPKHNILAEESGAKDGNSDYKWIIDPLDGTTNFVHGYPSFGISIGIIYRDEIICGVVKELPTNNTYSAIKGHGAFCNGKSISVSKVESLERALLVTGFSYNHDEKWEKNIELYREFVDITQGVRRLGAAAIDLCHIASGKADGFWEFDLKPWDTCAGILIVKEAGGKITQMDGAKFDIECPQILATNSLIHDEMINVLNPAIQSLRTIGIEI